MASVSQLTEESLDRFNAMEGASVSSPLRKTTNRASSIGSQESSMTAGTGRTTGFQRRELRGGSKFSPLKRFSMVALSTIMSRRMSFAGTSQSSRGRRAKTKQENTYKMTPDEGKKFSPAKVEAVMNMVLQQYLENEKYDPGTSANLTTILADVLKNRVKELNFSRYKIVSHVCIGQTDNNTVELGSRCLWDQSTDNYATATYRNESLFAVATVYGVYFE
ncbi:dynein light chain Tctex-type 5-like [Branchiostoma lanceolatum]|uniref:dynein light chain Tctex-type 5-like n=1 Tax=Branchiostoma lanceolatum TaxID=7740 RepID=UPI0034541536